MTVSRGVTRTALQRELTAIAGVELSGARRRKLNDLKLVTSEKDGRGCRHADQPGVYLREEATSSS